MEITDAIRSRKSIRRYKPNTVPREILEEILKVAIESPSAFNVQPWEISVVTGKVLDNIKQGNVEMQASGAAPNPDIMYKDFEGVYKQRQVACTTQLHEAMGIRREDKAARQEWNKQGLHFYDAPAAFILYADGSLDDSRLTFEIGVITQTICLAALNYGLGTCILRQGVYYPEIVRRFTGIPKSKRIVTAITIGYPDWELKINQINTQRVPLESITAWYGFD